MNYPVWDLTMGGGVLIAMVSILHVFISHFAVGGSLWLVLTEMRANRRGDDTLREYVRGHGRFFVLLTLVLGAITGVGIWFTIGLVSPQAVSALIHAYVWGWAMEWVFFFIEIAAALVYYYGWDRLDRKTHEAIGWIYFGAAFISLVIINGIITFMLTPGDWLADGRFWTGFFNPTYWPSVVLRTAACVALAGLFTLLTATRLKSSGLRASALRYNALWAVVGVAGTMGAALWYATAVPGWSEKLLGAIPVLPRVAAFFKWGLVATAVLALWPLIAPRGWRWPAAVLLLAVGIFTMGAGEWVREAARKPYTIRGFLFSNGMVADVSGEIVADGDLARLVADAEVGYAESRVQAEGVVATTRWIAATEGRDATALGRDLYRAHCQVCHTMDGYNGLRPFLARWNEETVLSLLPRLQHLRATMPPWYGTEEENRALAGYLLAEGVRGDANFPAEREAAEELAFAISCGLCHSAAGYRPLGDFFVDWEAEEIDEFLDEAGELVDEMPPYHGTPPQRELLVAYLQRLARQQVAAEESATASVHDPQDLVERSRP